jgi:small nuclear ribonucleoprotein (snRNP)-like protein
LIRSHISECGVVAQGFDEYMNLVLDDAEEVSIKRKTRKPVGEPSTLHANITRIELQVSCKQFHKVKTVILITENEDGQAFHSAHQYTDITRIELQGSCKQFHEVNTVCLTTENEDLSDWAIYSFPKCKCTIRKNNFTHSQTGRTCEKRGSS